MLRILLEEAQKTDSFVTTGSSGQIEKGYAISRQGCGVHDPSWVGRDSTLILGCHPEGSAKETEQCSAEWEFAIAPRTVARAREAILVVACDRRQGGLHSEREGSNAYVSVNNHDLDKIGLRDRPSGHTDFFHRVADQKIPEVPLINSSGTVYAFPVPVKFLSAGGKVKVKFTIDREVYWDIDHVGFVMMYPVKRIRPWVTKAVCGIICMALGAAFNQAVTLLRQ